MKKMGLDQEIFSKLLFKSGLVLVSIPHLLSFYDTTL